jgi:uncharacterized membrane protein YfcA
MEAWRIILGCICIYISSTLSSAAGVGGGSLNVPILINIFGFEYQDAVVLSLCTLMGNYMLQVLINLERRHPTSPQKPLIYWDAILILLPSELGGSNLGVLLSDAFPETIDYILALVVLLIAGTFTLSKALHTYEEETMSLYDDQSAATPLMMNDDDKSNDGSIHAKPTGQLKGKMPLWPKFLTCWKNQNGGKKEDDEMVPMNVPWVVIKVILAFWSFYVICYVIMKSYSICTVPYTIILCVIYALLICVILWGVNYLMESQRRDPDSIADGDITWDHSVLALTPVAFIIGIITALLGIGGGELFGPLMLKMQVSNCVLNDLIVFLSVSINRNYSAI